MTVEMEFNLWRVEAKRIHKDYWLYAIFGRQACVTEHLNEATFKKLATELSLVHEDTIANLIIKRDKEYCKEMKGNG